MRASSEKQYCSFVFSHRGKHHIPAKKNKKNKQTNMLFKQIEIILIKKKKKKKKRFIWLSYTWGISIIAVMDDLI